MVVVTKKGTKHTLGNNNRKTRTTIGPLGWSGPRQSKWSVLAKLPDTFPADDINITNEYAVKSSLLTNLDTDEQQQQPTIRASGIATSTEPVPTRAKTEAGRPIFGFPSGQPEVVDWLGCKRSIDAFPDGTLNVILCSTTICGTTPDHPLNHIGRSENDEGGMIVQYKRKAEMYLMNTKRMPNPIVHPSGLTDDASE
jgi:hypothetical protein